jgi:type IV secretory pathway VirD2 relaxase
MDPIDDFPIFRPRLGARSGRSSERGSGSLRNGVLAAMRGKRLALGPRRPAGRSRIAVRPPVNDARRVVIKAHYVRMTSSGAKAAALHLKYIERDGVERDGSRGVLYAADGPARAQAINEPRLGERHQFRIIVSPEDADQLDLTLYVRRLMASVERDLGRRLEWAAVNHYDTDNPHAHVVVRGVDRDGEEVRLPRAYVPSGLRWRAQELATEELGPRHEFEVRRAHAKEVAQDRFTSLDRELERRERDNRVEPRSRTRFSRIDESTLVARLGHLERLRLAERVGPVAWTLSPGWQDQLRELGSRGDIIRQIHKTVRGDPARYRIVRPGQPLEPDDQGAATVVTGRVASKGLSDEQKGAFYAVIEAPSGKAYHVAMSERAAEQVRPGDIVSLKSEPEPPLRRVDREIAKAAGASGGVYALQPTADGTPHPHARRVRDLERLGLATPEGPNRWTVPPDLLHRLDEHARAAPARHRLLIDKESRSIEQQLRHLGPVWLDGLRPDSLAPHGFGAELQGVVERRREALRHIGILPDDPHMADKLRDVERRAVGNGIAARTGLQFLAQVPDAFNGRVREEPTSPYAVVTDGMRFVLVPRSRDLHAFAGRTVVVVRDSQGRLSVRMLDQDRGR